MKSTAALALLIMGCWLGQSALAQGEQAPAVSAEEQRVAFLREKMSAYRLCSASAPELTYPLQEKLALRWTNPVSGVVDGGIFVWADQGRPMAIGKCFLNEAKEAWGEAIHSVSPNPMVMSRGEREVWKPAAAGVQFLTVGGPRTLADSTSGRLTQLRGLARQLEVVGIWGEKEASEWSLRMLTAPVHRYQSERESILEGAIFAFTQGGTNPEAIAIVEASQDEKGVRWQLAVTRLTQYGIRAKLGERAIADLPRNETPHIDEPFYRGWHWFRRYPFAKTASDTRAE